MAIELFDYNAKVDGWVAYCHGRYAADDLDAFFQSTEDTTKDDDIDRFLQLIGKRNLLDVYVTSCVFDNLPNVFDYLYLHCLLKYCDYCFRIISIMRVPFATAASPDLMYLIKSEFNDLMLGFCDAILVDCAFVETELAPILDRGSAFFPEEPDDFGKGVLQFVNGVYRQYQTGEPTLLDLGRYAHAYAQWNTPDPDCFAAVVRELFSIHRELSEDTRYFDDEFGHDEDTRFFEFNDHFYAAFPSEILLVYKLRDRLGLPNGPSFESLTGLPIDYPFHRYEDTGDPLVPRIRNLIKAVGEMAPRIPELYGKD